MPKFVLTPPEKSESPVVISSRIEDGDVMFEATKDGEKHTIFFLSSRTGELRMVFGVPEKLGFKLVDGAIEAVA